MKSGNFVFALLTSSLLTSALLTFATTLHAQRLPQTVRPEHYALTLAPDLNAATFTGAESIDVTLAEPSNRITLNAAEINFQSVTVTANGKQQTAVVSLDDKKEQATFTFPQKLPAGPATLAIHYSGILNNQLRGFYLSKTARRNYAVTQFESTDARRAFACFDEPAFKATYDVSLVIDSNDTAISNGPIISDTAGPTAGKHTLKFLTSPKMSTYLVVWLVGDFQCSAGESDGVAIRVCATPDKVALTKYGVGIAEWVLHYYNNYFGIPYPLKKLDLIGLPDFEAGAMENFGAITYRETDLLLDPKTATVGAQKEVALTIAHEMAHQWFGDLVTMQWWDNIWLNEGFATWMESKAVAVMHPEWNIDQQIVVDLGDTLNLDAQPTTRAIRAKAETREEIEQMFDDISYGKAGAVLGMVENYLGEETFRQGVHNYLAAHQFANATAEDFWSAQTAASHKPVDKIMQSLVAQQGEPLLTFGVPSRGQVSVTDKRFYLSPNMQPDPAQKWMLPICFKAGSSGQQCEVYPALDHGLKVPDGLFFANANGKGYYHSVYAKKDYAALVSQVESGLSPAERISLIGDEWAQVRANKEPVGDYLDLLSAVKADTSAEVLQSALKADPHASRVVRTVENFQAIDSQIAATADEKAALAEWIRKSFAPNLDKVGPPSAADSDNTRELRAKLFSLLGLYGKDPAVIAQARELAAKYMADSSSVDPTLAEAAQTIAARYGDAQLFDRLQQIYESSTNPEFQIGALHLLGQFEDPALAERALEYAASSKVRSQDEALQFSIALQIDTNRDLAWKYIQDHWEAIQPAMTPELGSRLVSATGNFCSAKERDSVEKFFAAHKVASTGNALKHAVENIDGCIELRATQEPKLKQWLAAQPKP
jgi:aminopeptidase N/puromycin-sensitive aminopeptidase